MYLEEAERLDAVQDNVPSFERWSDFPVSYPSHHGEPCCDTALNWLRSMDFAQLNGSSLRSGPRWLRKRFDWGPTVWPIHWCEAVDLETVDCGVHSAFAEAAFDGRGMPNFRVQIIQRYDEDAVMQWRCRWGSGNASDHWLGKDFIYHEGNALLIDHGEIKIWDGSAACWMNPRHRKGYGSAIAIKVSKRPNLDPDILYWGRHPVRPGQWSELVSL